MHEAVSHQVGRPKEGNVMSTVTEVQAGCKPHHEDSVDSLNPPTQGPRGITTRPQDAPAPIRRLVAPPPLVGWTYEDSNPWSWPPTQVLKETWTPGTEVTGWFNYVEAASTEWLAMVVIELTPRGARDPSVALLPAPFVLQDLLEGIESGAHVRITCVGDDAWTVERLSP